MIDVAINVRQRDGETHGNTRIPAQTFDNVTIDLKFDSVASTFKLDFDFDPQNKDHAELACPTHMHECEINYTYKSGFKRRLITGFMLSQGFANSQKPELAQLGGYSRSGLLADCDIPPDCPIESNGLTFRQVVEKVLKSLNSTRKATIGNPLKFKIGSARADEILNDVDHKKGENSDTADLRKILTQISTKADAVINKTTAPESVNALSYLKEIAIQKRLIISHDGYGNIIIGVPNTSGKPLFEVDNTEFGTKGITDIKLVIDGQHMHSHITVIRQADKDGGNAAEHTIENPLCPIVYRPKVVSLTFGDDVTIEQAARNELGNDLRGIVLKVTTDRWEIDGQLLLPNNCIIVKDPKNYLYKKTRFFIESVQLTTDGDQETAILTCVLPYVYNDATPVNPFVEPGKNTPLS